MGCELHGRGVVSSVTCCALVLDLRSCLASMEEGIYYRSGWAPLKRLAGREKVTSENRTCTDSAEKSEGEQFPAPTTVEGNLLLPGLWKVGSNQSFPNQMPGWALG